MKKNILKISTFCVFILLFVGFSWDYRLISMNDKKIKDSQDILFINQTDLPFRSYKNNPDENDEKKTPLIYLNTYIENGSKLNWEIKDDGIIYIDLPYDYERNTLNRAFDHLHFLLEAPAGTDITMIFQNFNEIYNGKPVAFRDWITDVVISSDGRKWQHRKVEWLEGAKMKVNVHMETDSLYIARVEPYRLSDLKSLISGIRKAKNVKIIPVGKSVEGRPLEIIQIGKPDAPHRIFIRGRVHPWEAGTSWVIEGIIKTLVEAPDISGKYLKNYCLFVLPMANIDGVARGLTRFNLNGMDLNRNLTKPADPGLSPENAAMEKWLENMITHGLKPDLAIDFHNDAGGKLIFSSSAKESGNYSEHMKILESLLTTYTWFREGSSYGTGTSFEEGMWKQYGIEALVYELNAYWIKGLQKPPLSDDWKLLGKQLCHVLDEYFRKGE